MPQFEWQPYPSHGGCLSCLTQECKSGFVNTLAETKLTRNDYEITGFADVIFCGDCLLQQARLVGAASPDETMKFAERELDLINENEKLADEVKAWKERFEKAFDLTVESLDMPGDEELLAHNGTDEFS